LTRNKAWNVALHAVCGVTLSVQIGCGGDSPPGETPVDSAATPVAQDRVAIDPIPIPANLDSLRPVLDTLERRLARSSAADSPALLLQLGRARTAFDPDRGSVHADYATARTSAFWYNEIGANYLYNGADLRALIGRFPGSALVDDAAYAITRLPMGGECEGFVACYVGRQWEPLSEFLRAHPQSAYADSAIERVLAGYAQIDSTLDLRAATDYVEPAELRKLVAQLDSMGRDLPAPRGVRLLERAGQLWEQFADYDQARSAYQAALPNADGATQARIRERMAQLPTQTFTLEPAQVIHPGRVELRWQLPGMSARGFVVHRSNTRMELGNVAARLSATSTTWNDTTTQPGTSYWYRVAAETAGGTLQSNPSAAETPTLELRVQHIAVSPADRRLHVFGRLSNSFPQLLRISPDGKSLERSGALAIGRESTDGRQRLHDQRVDDVWLVDQNGTGVLHFRRSNGELPARLSAAVRRGGQLLPTGPEHQSGTLLVSVEDSVAWIERGGGGSQAALATDCVRALSACWVGREQEVFLRSDAGSILTRVQLPRDARHLDASWTTAVYADPRDGSAWVLLGRSARLLHVDRAGTIRREIELAELNQAYSVALTADLDRHIIWFTRRGPQQMELVKLNVEGAQQTFVLNQVRGVPRLVPDLQGGVWLVDYGQARRIDDQGRTVVTVELNGK
jgi:hypothetical protein